MSTGSPPHPANGGDECRWRMQKSRFWAYIWLHHMLWTVPAASAIHSAATDHNELMTLVTRSWWHSSLVSGGVCWWRETITKCMTRSLKGVLQLSSYLLYYSWLRDSIESYDVNCKQNQTEYGYSISTSVINTLQHYRINILLRQQTKYVAEN